MQAFIAAGAVGVFLQQLLASNWVPSCYRGMHNGVEAMLPPGGDSRLTGEKLVCARWPHAIQCKSCQKSEHHRKHAGQQLF